MRKGQLANGEWKWWNFDDKLIILKKQKAKNRRPESAPQSPDAPTAPDAKGPDTEWTAGSGGKRAGEDTSRKEK